MSVETHDIQKEIKKYVAVFFGLLVLTVVTVLASNFHLGVILGVTVALMIAVVKGGLVACNFMHLTSEKKLIYLVLILTAIFFISMMLLFVVSHFNLPEGAYHVS